jgi:protein-tyrosine-phosphatase
MANYCRSPVAEVILKELHKNNFEFISAGISPMAKSGMDPRSIKFLEKNGYKAHIHTPRKINSKLLTRAYKVFILDIQLLFQMNQIYKNYSSKFLLLNHHEKNLALRDPYHLENNDYDDVLKRIETVCESLAIRTV